MLDATNECDDIPAEEYEGFVDKLKTQRDMRLQKTYTSERDLKKSMQAEEVRATELVNRKDQSYLSFVNSASYLKLNQSVRTASNNRLAGT